MTALLGCGIAYPLTYVVANEVIAAARYPGHSRIDQAVSDLSATGAPTRRVLTAMLPVFTGLTVAYGAGVGTAAGRRQALRTTGLVLTASGSTGIAWLPFPRSSPDLIAHGAATAGETGHLVMSRLLQASVTQAEGADDDAAYPGGSDLSHVLTCVKARCAAEG